MVVGQRVVLECALDSYPEPAIKWLKDGQNVTQCPDYQIGGAAGNRYQLVIADVQGADSGRFTCQASNAAGSKTSSAMLIVAPAPSPMPGAAPGYVPASPAPPQTPVGPAAPLFLKDLKHQLLKPGANATLECRVIGNPVPDIQWFKDGQPVAGGFRYKMEDDPVSGICALSIAMLNEGDLGEYAVVAANEAGSAQSSARLLLREDYADWLSEEQRAITVEKKRSMMAEVEAAVTGPRVAKPKGAFYRPKTERWLDQAAAASAYEAAADSERWLGWDAGSAGREEDWALVGNSGPAAAPRFSAPLRSLRLSEGGDALLQASVDGNPRPRVHWLRNGFPLSPSRRFSTSFKGSMVVLAIQMVFPEDSGRFPSPSCRPFLSCPVGAG